MRLLILKYLKIKKHNMNIHLFKLIYPSGYVRKGLTLIESIKLMKGRKDIVFKTDKIIYL